MANGNGGDYHPIVVESGRVEKELVRLGIALGDQERYAIHLLVEAKEIVGRSATALAAISGFPQTRRTRAEALEVIADSLAELDVGLCSHFRGHLDELKRALPSLAAAVDSAASSQESGN